MTVRSEGFEWWREFVDRHEIRLFRRVQSVEFTGEQFTRAHLQKASHFKQLKTLVLSGTSITPREVTEWHREHPRVEVRMTSGMGELMLAARG